MQFEKRSQSIVVSAVTLAFLLLLGERELVCQVCTDPGAPGDYLGSSFANAGRVDADLVDDYVVGAPEGGYARVYSGATGALIITIPGSAADNFGHSVAGIGDINGDGRSDWIISAVAGSANYAQVISGLDGSVLHHAASPYPYHAGYGYHVSGAGDIDQDGVPDYVVGAPGIGSTPWNGAFEVLSGATHTTIRSVDGGSGLNGSNLGITNAPVGDVNGDGHVDLAVGAMFYNGTRGLARVYSGVWLHLGTGPDVLQQWQSGSAGDFFGVVQGLGDLDGDGRPDVAVGAPQYNIASGYVRTFSGASGADLVTVRKPACAQGSSDFFSNHMTAADVDGDGRRDLIVSASTLTGLGSVWAYSGQGLQLLSHLDGTVGERFATSVAAIDADLDGRAEIVASAESHLGNQGRACVLDSGAPAGGVPQPILTIPGTVAGGFQGGVNCGDVNGDQIDDVIAGSGVGHARVYSGSTGALIHSLAAHESAADKFGFAVDGIGDITGDGRADFIVSGVFGNYAKVFSGSDGSLLAMHSLTGSPEAGYGYAVSAAGDIDGDSVPDYVIGAPGVGPTAWLGRFDVFSGATRALIRTVGGNGANFAGRLTAVGDVNGDGFDDLAVGNHFYNSYQGRVYLCSGALLVDRQLLPDDAVHVDQVALWQRNGISANDQYGHVSRAGDVDGDGRPDILVGAHQPFGGVGYLQVLDGPSGAVLATLTNPSCGAAANDFFGLHSSGGDLDGDSHADIVVGAPGTGRPGAFFVFSGADFSLICSVDGAFAEALGTDISLGNFDTDAALEILASANEATTAAGPNAGAAHVYEYCGELAPPSPLPVELIQSTLLSEFGFQAWNAGIGSVELHLSPGGGIVITGSADASGQVWLPRVNATQSVYGGGEFDAWVLKVDTQTNEIAFSTLLGGSQYDQARDVAVDAAGNVYVALASKSPDFPGAVNALHGVDYDMVIAKLNACGALERSFYLGGTGDDGPAAIAVDFSAPPGSFRLAIGGTVRSPDFALVSPLVPTPPEDAWWLGDPTAKAVVAIVEMTSSPAVTYSSYSGGGGWKGQAVAIDASGVFVAGAEATTPSSERTFIVKHQPGAALAYTTYVGSGSNRFTVEAMRVDAGGSLYLGGLTGTPNLPTTPAAVQPTHGGGVDGYAAKLGPGGALEYATFLGKAGDDYVYGVGFDAIGNFYLAGSSPDLTLVRDFGYEPRSFLAVLDATVSPSYSQYIVSTTIGWAVAETLAVDGAGNAFIAGSLADGPQMPIVNPLPGTSSSSSGGFLQHWRVGPDSGQSPGPDPCDSVDLPPVAQCVAVLTVQASAANCLAAVQAAQVDDGSYDPEGGPVTLTLEPPGPYAIGESIVVLKVRDSAEQESQCTTTLTVAPPSPVELLATGDSFLRSGNADRNEGANPRLRVQSSGQNRSLLSFDLGGIDLGCVVSAHLRLTIAENANNWGNGSGRPVDAHPLLVAFAEGNGKDADLPPAESTRGTGAGVTWKCAADADIANQATDCNPAWNGGTFGAATAAPVLHSNGLAGEIEWNVTADVLAGTSGWIIKKTQEGQSGQMQYYSREGAAAAGYSSLGPRLVVEFE